MKNFYKKYLFKYLKIKLFGVVLLGTSIFTSTRTYSKQKPYIKKSYYAGFRKSNRVSGLPKRKGVSGYVKPKKYILRNRKKII